MSLDLAGGLGAKRGGAGVIFELNRQDERRLLRTLDTIENKVRKRILGKAVRAAAKPILKQARTNAPRRTTVLKRALITKVKRYKNGNVVAAIGPEYRKDRKTGKRTFRMLKATKSRGALKVDAFYAHMVEKGTAPHEYNGPVLINGQVVWIKTHPGTRATHFLKRSMQGQRQQAKRAFVAKAWAEINAEAKKARVKL